MRLARDVDRNWFASNTIMCNQTKDPTHLAWETQHGKEAESVKILGIFRDTKLSWVDHVGSVCKKISRVSYLIWKLRDVVSVDYLRMAYFGPSSLISLMG